MMIGIDQNRFVLYEGQAYYGHAVWPQPHVSRARVIQEEDWKNPPKAHDTRVLVFREDMFDPVTRIRRGRLYAPSNNAVQSHDWRVQPHPAYNEQQQVDQNDGFLGKNLLTYFPYLELSQKKKSGIGAMVLLGEGTATSAWTAISIERGFSGEDFVTLRARSNFGRLPEIDFAAVPEDARQEIGSEVSALVDRAFRESAVSVVDRCGNVAQLVLSRWLLNKHGDSHCLTKDLSAVAGHIENKYEKLVVLSCSVKVLARLHARGKPNEQFDKRSRPLNESDAETALTLVSTILWEIGWAAP
jgi:hypothetical protein